MKDCETAKSLGLEVQPENHCAPFEAYVVGTGGRFEF